jgi:hypothetical protein
MELRSATVGERANQSFATSTTSLGGVVGRRINRLWARRSLSVRFDSLRRVLAVILLSAAVLKSFQHESANTLGPTWLLVFTVEVELFMGIWLLSGLFPARAWIACAACFVVFECTSLHHAFDRIPSCGCFGDFQVSPWVSAAIDLCAILALAACAPSSIHVTRAECERRWWRVALPLAFFLVLAVPLAAIAGSDGRTKRGPSDYERAIKRTMSRVQNEIGQSEMTRTATILP